MAVTPEVALPAQYRVDEVLNENASTCVYRVYDLVDRREEAIKILRHEFTRPEELLQFKAEFATLASLDHPGIIKVFDFGLLEERFPYFTMEYFPGKRITEFFHGRNWEELYGVLLQIASGLHHIHHFGIVHLDVKPSNVVVGDDGKVKLMDFGVAAASHQLFDRRIRGTLHYMAPEVLRQDKIDGRADLYSLGITMYETVTGALPTYGKPPIEIMRFHLEGEIRRPSAINPNIPEALEKIILKLLEKDPRHRYPSAVALFHDIAAAAGIRVPAGELLVGKGELLAAPLIGRSRELAELMDLIGHARRNKGAGVIVAGPEGSGKSRIVREATLRAQLEGARVFYGRCPINRKSIYAPFFEIFQQMVMAVNPAADAMLELRRILRPLVSTSNDAKPFRGQKFRLYNRIVQSIQDFYGLLNALGATSSPLILVIEDLQWADPSTAELFTFLIGEARHSSLAVIGTLTTEGANEAFEETAVVRSAWEQRARESEIHMIEIGPLTEDLTREYLESLLGDQNLSNEFVRWILWESGGSPMHIRRGIDYLIAHELLHSTVDGWVAEMGAIQNLRIPGGAAAAWADKLASLDEEERNILQIASVLGEQFDLSLLTAVADVPQERTYSIVHRLASEELLNESSDGRRFSFPQMSLREAVYPSMHGEARARSHQRAAEVLESLFTEGAHELLGQVAYHYGRGTDHQKGIDYSIRAGTQASSVLAHEQAAEFYRIALELMDLSGDEKRKPEVREKLADSYYRSSNFRGAMQVYQFLLKSTQARTSDEESLLKTAGLMKKIGKVAAKRAEYDSALSYFQSAIQIYQGSGTAIDVAELLNRSAWIYKDKGDLADAERSATAAERMIQRDPLAPIHGYVKNTRGVIAFARGDWQSAGELYQQGLEIAQKLGSEQLRKVATTNVGNVKWKTGRWDEALEYYRRNLEQSENEGDLWDLVTAYNNVAKVEFSRGNFHIAGPLFEKSIRIDEKLGSPEHEALALENLGQSLEMVGRWAEAREKYQRCFTLEGFDENRTSRISVYVPFARLLSKAGDIPRALQFAHKAYDAADHARDADLRAEAAFILALIESERENYPESNRYLTEAIALFEQNGTAHGLARGYMLAAETSFRQQKIEEAAGFAEKSGDIARELGDRFTLARNEALIAKILFVTGERDAAEKKFATAQSVLDELDTPYELGRLLFDFGVLREDAEEAGASLRRAIKIFERLDATSDIERARGALFRIKPAGRGAAPSVVGLYEIVKIVNSTLNLEEVLNRVLDIALRRLRAERGMILLFDPITNALRTRVARNIKDGGEGEAGRSPQSIIKEVIQSGHSVISADARTDERFVDSQSVISENIVSTLCVPLVIRERIAGAIYVDHRETTHLFSQRDLTFLEAFADQAAIAIDNARLYEELEQARMRLSLENESLRKEVLVEKHLDSVVGHSEAVARIQFTIRKAASSNSTVLIRGESGTGKGLVARIIHNVGTRRNGPFIHFNCAALPETLAESELFGHEKGSFTGADRRKLGRFELANGGTIFLDEIGKVSLAIQSKLLRVVEEKEFERVGGTQTIKTDVKIIAATNLQLEKAIEEGSFREDLFYRLNIIPLTLQPLRERKEDIPLLVEHFMKKICRDLGIDTKRLEPGILDLFNGHDWPGNIRELEATLHRAIVMSNGGTLTRSDFYGVLSEAQQLVVDSNAPFAIVPSDLLNPVLKRVEITSQVYDDILSRVDRQLIEQVLAETGGKIRETARRLGLARNTLKAKMQKYDIVAAG